MKNKAFEKDGHVYCRQCGERIDSDPLNGLGNKKIIFRRQCKCDREEESLRKAKEEAERIIMNSRPKNPKYARNKNVLVIGGSGSGKTRILCNFIPAM